MKSELLVFLLLLLLTAVQAIKGDWISTPTILLCGFSFAIYARERCKNKRQEFVEQLKTYANELLAGSTINIDHFLLRYESIVTSYRLSLGVVFCSITIDSPYRLVTGEEHHEALFFSLCSLVSGWWAVPYGPFITMDLIRRNLSGGYQKKLSELIDDLPEELDRKQIKEIKH